MLGKSILKIAMVAAPLILICGVLASIASAAPRSESSRVSATDEPDLGNCSNRTLSGDYGFALEGVILGPNIPFRGVVMQHYDGKGNLTQVDHVVTNGTPPAQEWSPGSGTYTVNPDCTGSAVINSSSNPFPLKLHFVVVKHGTEIHQVVDGNAVTAVGIKVE